MAHLTASQKKKRNAFVALLVGIVVVLAAIVLIVYSGIMSKSAFLKNGGFADALSQIFDKNVRSVSESDLLTVKSVAVVKEDGSDVCTVSLGFDDYLTEYNAYVEQSEAKDAAQTAYDEAKEAFDAAEENGESTEGLTNPDDITIPEVTAAPQNLLKSASADFSSLTMDDIKYFENAEIVYLDGVKLGNADVIKSLKALKEGSFVGCGITDVSVFSELNLDEIKSLDLTDNEIDDWSALEGIADKVTVETLYYEIEGYGKIPYSTVTLDQKLGISDDDETVDDNENSDVDNAADAGDENNNAVIDDENSEDDTLTADDESGNETEAE